MRAIQKSLSIAFKTQIHINSINQWIKNSSKVLGEELERIDKLKCNISQIKPKNIKVLEMDELFTYIKKTQKF